MADKKNYTEKDVLDAWEQDDKKGAFEIVEVKTEDGEQDQTQIFEVNTGSLVVAVDGTGSDALKKLAENPRNHFIDPGLPSTKALDGEVEHTSKGVLRTPTHPQDLAAQQGLGELNPRTLETEK